MPWPSSAPFGRLAFVAWMAARTSSVDRPYWFSWYGFRSTRTAGSEPPPISTSPTPFTWAIFCWMTFDTSS